MHGIGIKLAIAHTYLQSGLQTFKLQDFFQSNQKLFPQTCFSSLLQIHLIVPFPYIHVQNVVIYPVY